LGVNHEAQFSFSCLTREISAVGFWAMLDWSIQNECGGFPVERAAIGAFRLLVLYADGEWQWLVRQGGYDIAEGAARAARAARQQAEAVALRLGAAALS
jgi:hypothetical protein